MDYILRPINSPFAVSKDTYECYRVKIAWRKKLKKSAFYYGYGAKQTLDPRLAKSQKGDAVEWSDIRKHQRKPYSKSIRFAAKDLLFEGFLKNISSAGVFIEANENFSAGQILTFKIPLKKNQTANVKGEVVWSSPDGFGGTFLGLNKTRTHLKIFFWPNIFVGAALQILNPAQADLRLALK
jgi:Tfp pilus assembly protein PilZ